MPKRVGGQPVTLPKQPLETKTAGKAKETPAPRRTGTGGAKNTADTQQIATPQGAREVAAATVSVPDLVRFIKQSFEQLDAELQAIPFNQKMPLADSLRGYGDPPPATAALQEKMTGLFSELEGKINQLPPTERAQLYGMFSIPYDANTPDGHIDNPAINPPGMNNVNPMTANQNPNLMANRGVNNAGANGQPQNALANQLPAGNPMMMGADAQNLTQAGPSQPFESLKEIVVQRLSFAGIQPTPLNPINWQNPLGNMADAGPVQRDIYGITQDQVPQQQQQTNGIFQQYETLPTPPLGQASAAVVAGAVGDRLVDRNELVSFCTAIAQDLIRAMAWGATPQQFFEEMKPLFSYFAQNAQVAPGSEHTAQLFQARMGQLLPLGPTPEAFLMLANELRTA